jgi:hypothetical protein
MHDVVGSKLWTLDVKMVDHKVVSWVLKKFAIIIIFYGVFKEFIAAGSWLKPAVEPYHHRWFVVQTDDDGQTHHR